MNDFTNMPPMPPPPTYLATSSSSTGGATSPQNLPVDAGTVTWLTNMYNAIIPRYQKIEEGHIKVKEQLAAEREILTSFKLLVYLCYCLFLFSSAVFIITGILVYLLFIDGSSADRIDQVFNVYKWIGYGTFIPITGAAVLFLGLRKRVEAIEKKLSGS